jgi:argininosuccinate lyase
VTRLWNRGEPTDALVLRYTVGEDHLWDARLVPYDARASIAHAEMLSHQGYLDPEDCARLTTTLQALATEHAEGKWSISVEEEDVHTALENRLTERLGELGGRIHLGRSRNDQVLVALRLYLREAIDELSDLTRTVVAALSTLAADQGAIPLPGYTHLQRAMPSTVALWAEAYAVEMEDDREGLLQADLRLRKNPLGSAAGYGTPGLTIDRDHTTRALGFDVPHVPVTAVQLSRGKAEAHVVFALTLLLQDLGRLASDLCLFATDEFGFVRLPHAFTTGSSIMPQKRNPDVFELVRAHAAQLPGDLQSILAVTQKMPSGYHRDLQLLKPPLFRALDVSAASLQVMAHALPGIRFQRDRTEAAMDPSLFAAEQAYRLVTEEGIPFREAYRRVKASMLKPPP